MKERVSDRILIIISINISSILSITIDVFVIVLVKILSNAVRL